MVRETLTPATRSLIKEIKERTVESPKYLKAKWGFTTQANTFRSLDIYLAVLRDGVRSPQEFAQYLLQERGIDARAELGASPVQPSITRSNSSSERTLT
jgi:hypothetical protein